MVPTEKTDIFPAKGPFSIKSDTHAFSWKGRKHLAGFRRRMQEIGPRSKIFHFNAKPVKDPGEIALQSRIGIFFPDLLHQLCCYLGTKRIHFQQTITSLSKPLLKILSV